jgi:hypothetical protein
MKVEFNGGVKLSDISTRRFIGENSFLIMELGKFMDDPI